MSVCPICGFDSDRPPTRSQRDIDAYDEWLFIRACEELKTRLKRRYLTHRQLLQLLRTMGYHKAPR